MAPRQPKRKPLVGWREWVLLPDFSPVVVKAKIDTGARTSALHAFDLKIEDRDGKPWADFEIHPLQRSKARACRVSTPINGYRRIRSSTGHSETRPVVRTVMRIGDHNYKIDLTLTSRDEMGFRMLLGRAAIRRRFLVDPGRSFLHPASTDPEHKEG
jgi:hypothetical protein